MRSLVQSTPAYELSVDIAITAHGHGLKLISFVPTARHPEDHVKFQGVFSTSGRGNTSLLNKESEPSPLGRHEPANRRDHDGLMQTTIALRPVAVLNNARCVVRGRDIAVTKPSNVSTNMEP